MSRMVPIGSISHYDMCNLWSTTTEQLHLDLGIEVPATGSAFWLHRGLRNNDAMTFRSAVVILSSPRSEVGPWRKLEEAEVRPTISLGSDKNRRSTAQRDCEGMRYFLSWLYLPVESCPDTFSIRLVSRAFLNMNNTAVYAQPPI